MCVCVCVCVWWFITPRTFGEGGARYGYFLLATAHCWTVTRVDHTRSTRSFLTRVCVVRHAPLWGGGIPF